MRPPRRWRAPKYPDMMADATDDFKHARVATQDIDSIAERGDDPPKKIILCFDGTTNDFKGNDSDTNVVKLFEMFDRLDKHQYHYYQPGIGTYVANTTIRNVQTNDFGSKIKAKSDEMFASSFAEHVIAGYKFLMRYYMEGDQVYVFGFSRGAYTARFLCELLNDVGLLSKGNEENLPFLWYHYSDYRRNPIDEVKEKIVQDMARVFCRKQRHNFVYWLGLWDCVNSVAKFRTASEISRYANASPNIALHVRHAVSCHERRVMFRPTLFIADANLRGTCQERWFAGNHGDVGGGWQPADDKTLLLSDIPLIWMVTELQKQERLDAEHGVSQLQIRWRTADPNDKQHYKEKNRNTFDERKANLDRQMERLQRGLMKNINTIRHDVLSFGRSRSKIMVFVWWFMECLPLAHTVLRLKRSDEWERQPNGQLMKKPHYIAQPSHTPSGGSPRRIPLEPNGVIDPSIELLYRAGIVPSMVKFGDATGKEVKTNGQFRFFDS